MSLAADQLVAQFADRHRTIIGSHEHALVEFVLSQLADPRSDHGELLDDICQRRWLVGQVSA